MAIGKRWQGDKTAKTRESLQKLKSRKGVSPEGYGRELVSDMKAYYGHMAAETGTFWEFKDGHDSRCHAIGSYVAVLLARAVFGIERIDWAGRTMVLGTPSVKLDAATCILPVREGVVSISADASGRPPHVVLPRGWRAAFRK